ncbi:MAG: tRNA (adenosine(37)-N6)-dimethylallyltransferase MiaA [Gammaproteobacteria bacterium]|nr:tRNA (adenosine(37)-N6)-dimethylallyltransferase MiaA [Gammaproteobacteria bacterium]
MSSYPRRIATLIGPTASGKTELSLALAHRVDTVLISVDSAMVYRGLDIGTAKPSIETRQAFPHALIDIRDPEDSFSVQEFCALADDAVRTSLAAGKLPLLVGGSMMYFRAFREGLANLPSANSRIRAEIRKLAEHEGLEAVHAELRRIDPDSALRISPRNLKRMERAIEVYRLTGKPIGELWKDQAVPPASERLDCELVEFVMPDMPRQVLHDRIESRLRSMFVEGLVEEVRSLRQRPNLYRESLSMRTVGYREIWAHLDEQAEHVDEGQIFEKVLAATRRLARKQLTWLRQWSTLKLIEATSTQLMIDRLEH